MRLAGLLHRAARLCRGCVPWSSRGAAAPQLCGGRVPIIQALKAAGGSGSRRSAVCRFSARSLCAGAVRRGRAGWCVVWADNDRACSTRVRLQVLR
jgi:hypothetical protein